MAKDWVGNGNSIYKTLGASNHTDQEREENDFYATDPRAIDKLFTVEEFSKKIYEVSAGQGHLSERMKSFGKDVVSSDLIDRGYGLSGVDFLKMSHIEENCDIITNPPYKIATEFIYKSLDLVSDGNKVAMFLKIQFLEGQERRKLYDKYPPKNIYVF